METRPVACITCAYIPVVAHLWGFDFVIARRFAFALAALGSGTARVSGQSNLWCSGLCHRPSCGRGGSRVDLLIWRTWRCL